MTGQNGVFAWDSPEFRRLLAQHQPGPAFALIREAQGLTQEKFANLVNWGRTNTGRIERGERQALYDIRELTRVADALGIPRAALLPALLGTPEPGTIEDTDSEGVGDVDRRQFGQFGLTVFGTAIFSAAASKALAGAATPQTVGDDHLGYLSDVADQLWAHDRQFGSGGLLEPALQQYALARRLLDHGRYDDRTGSELAVAAGNMADCAGWLACDSGAQDTARQLFTEALVLTERSENGGTGISEKLLWQNIMDDLTQQAWRVGNMREGLQLSRRVNEASRHIPSARLQALHAARLSVAYAAVGDARESDAAIAHAWREVDRGLDDPNDPIWLHFVTPAEIHSIAAQAKTYLGQHDKAAATYGESVGAHNKPRDNASYRAYYAASLAHLGDTRTAIVEGLAALSILEGPVTSPRLVAELLPVRAAAGTSTVADSEEFRIRFDTMRTGSAQTLS